MSNAKLQPHHPRNGLGKRITMELRRNYVLYLLVLIPLTFLLIFSYKPLYGIQIAFRDFKITRGFSDGKWVWFKYFEKFFNSHDFWPIMRNTLWINFYSLLTFPCSLILALSLNYLPFKRYKKTIQMVSYAPHFISTVVMCGIVLQFLDARTGLINALLKLVGVTPANWIGKPEYFASIYVWSGVWQGVGYSSIIYIAALASVSPELHEAAIVDGATIMQRIRHIDIPSILPTFCILLIMQCGSLLNTNFEKILLLQNDLNRSVSQTIGTFTYEVGLTGIPQYSYSTAIGMFSSVINIIMLLTVNAISNKLTETGLF